MSVRRRRLASSPTMSHRDDLRAHRLRLKRITDAMLARRTDSVTRPARAGVAVLTSGSVAAISLAAVALFAVLAGGGGD